MFHKPIIGADSRRVTVMQGQARASNEPGVSFTTVLGSCIATCLYDPIAMVGGMNHFLLSEPPRSSGQGVLDEHYGAYLMEVLINEMLGLGASKARMKAHLYGGANMHRAMLKIGTANGAFAKSFLERERIPVMHADLGGTDARRVEFLPTLGKARCRSVAEQMAPQPVERRPRDTGDVELF
ncbi:chemotaxis protein CheD [Sphingomonas sp.]|uniref:chemotaxis protein CheD n=1 Tax=Sphingomonas sp. TaxID=28214 RepID=UPI001D7B9F84|nr:chemotaxis protein CheD [Sphingomonas sp.]MBX9795688.1 chemotaxis protein CheD [Sphingomonas sp.]